MHHYEKSIEHTAAFEKRWGDVLHRIDDPSAPGDGTVHRGSNARVGPAIESVSRHIETNQPFEFTHDGTYGNSVVRSQVAFWLNEFAEEQLA